MSKDQASNERFMIMKRKLYALATPIMLLALGLGLYLMFEFKLLAQLWM